MTSIQPELKRERVSEKARSTRRESGRTFEGDDLEENQQARPKSIEGPDGGIGPHARSQEGPVGDWAGQVVSDAFRLGRDAGVVAGVEEAAKNVRSPDRVRDDVEHRKD